MKILILAIGFLLLVFHLWASRRSPRLWFLGGVIPLLYAALLVWRGMDGQLTDADTVFHQAVVPMLILLLSWAEGQQMARKRERGQMRARDL